MDSDTVATLVKKRASLKTKLTHFENYISSLESDLNAGKLIDRVAINELNNRIERFEQVILIFDEIQNDIELKSPDPEEHYEYRETFETRYHSALAKAKTHYADLTLTNTEPSTDNQNRVPTEARFEFDEVRLPTIQLPKYNGRYEQWMEFRDSYESLIHKRPRMSNIQKFHYLRASLEGAAAEVIKTLEFSAETYEMAWHMLCERFNNEKLLIHNHVKSIFNINSLCKESAQKIRSLSDDISKHLTALKQLGEPVESWDTLIIYIISQKLDSVTAQEWEKQRFQSDKPTIEDFKGFLHNRANLLETLERNFIEKRDKPNFKQTKGFTCIEQNKNSETGSASASQGTYACYFCKGPHSIFYCSQFLKLPVRDRMSKVRQLKLCNNCLRSNHEANQCRLGGCKICKGRHNTVLHEHRELKSVNVNQASATEQEPHNTNDHSVADSPEQTTSCTTITADIVVLSTALVYVYDDIGTRHTARALLDCGSQSSFISSELAKKLKLIKQKTNLMITGINNSSSFANYKCNVKIFSRCNSFSFDLSCFIIDKITGHLPNSFINKSNWKIPSNIHLADEDFNVPAKIDVLIGAEAFWRLLCVGQVDIGPQKPLLQKTRLGWIVAGFTTTNNSFNKSVCHFAQTLGIQEQLSKFWEVEEVNSCGKVLSIEETLCENHFTENVKISSDGRYIVSIPFKGDVNSLGDSYDIAFKMFLQLEKRLQANSTLRNLYVEFLREYERLGHMTKVESDEKPDYFMPHHGVLRETSLTTKLRVVFNASSPTSTGVSLNSLQMTGPIIQRDLFSILLSFRTHEIVLSSDIRMMYRQVLIEPSQRKFQKIIWRENPDDPLSIFQLNTVTYGTTAGSFLAIRCLFEVANEIEHEYPKIAEIIRNDMYVDDLLTGCSSVPEAKLICQQMYDILKDRGFELRKWRSNHPETISNVTNSASDESFEFSLDKAKEYKTLGLSWNYESDSLNYKFSFCQLPTDKVTKRTILSKVAAIFDPLGLLNPCIVLAKILLQRLWLEKLTWDESVSLTLHQQWLEFASELDSLNSLNIPRKVVCCPAVCVELHGFSDASVHAYGACVFIRSVNDKGECLVRLLCAKSRVAPLKTLTTPRLELCAALILARLIKTVIESLKLKLDNVYCWSDSTIVLCWLRTPPNLLKPFVDNRVAEIQKLTHSFSWRHVPTADNPADLLSRGVKPQDIYDCDIWWHGPSWLKYDQSHWPNINPIVSDLPELRKHNFNLLVSQSFPFERYSNLNRLKRSFAYLLRFITNCRKPASERICSTLSLEEIEDSFEILIRMSQKMSFSVDYERLKNKKHLRNNSSILSLNPFIDENQIIRVGGRIHNSEFAYSKKHPILLSHSHHLTKLILEHEHRHLLHAGPQLLLSHIREQFWVTCGRSAVRYIVKRCVRCSRFMAKGVQPIMGNLPAARIVPSFPFSTVGVDYAGPLLIKDRRGRGCKISKCWVALFICFATRAVHLELVTSLSTDAFLQTLKRFIARRGKPSNVYSDHGTNFVGASRELSELWQFFDDNVTCLSDQITHLGIKWHFSPPNSPHFGGIWEAAVKSVKHHLRRVMGNLALTFEDLYTLLVQVESVLNTRPLHPLSSDPNDLSSLTPAHFLIGRSLVAIPEQDLTIVSNNRLDNYQQIQRLQQQFWSRWSKDYIHELQQRTRWKQSKGSLQEGQLVLVKEDNLPPLKWRLGRVSSLIAGKDGVHRVALVKTADGTFTRALNRLCPLPVVESQDFQGGGHVNATHAHNPASSPDSTVGVISKKRGRLRQPAPAE